VDDEPLDVPLEEPAVPLVPPDTGATAEDCPPAAACDDVDVW
jgi:hypothetical protein